MKLYHFTNVKLNSISPKFFGANYYTKKDKACSNIKRAFYYDKLEPQEFLLSDTEYGYEIEVEKDLIYDLIKDKDNLISKAKGDCDKIFKLIKKNYIGVKYDCGFICYAIFKTIKIKNKYKQAYARFGKYIKI